MLRSIELFTGAGGMALGLSRAGVQHRLLVEFNRDACATLRANLGRLAGGSDELVLHEGDVRDVSFQAYSGSIDLLAAGAPCQPFSIAGKHRTHNDSRNLFPEVFRAQRELTPRAVVIENVRGLLRATLDRFVRYLTLQLSFPFVTPRGASSDGDWAGHLSLLEKVARQTKHTDPRYHVGVFLLQAADFGVPQKRDRVFFVAYRDDVGATPRAPQPTHSADALHFAKWVSGDYWLTHGLRRPERVPPALVRKVEALRDADPLFLGKPWRTVRDAIKGLPKPASSSVGAEVPDHILQRGARAYPGHTGSPLDAPAKTLKAGVHGVPGGENMLRNPNGTVRYFTVREAARLQSFPDDYKIFGAWGEAMRQIGNAVPVDLAEAVARSVGATLSRGAERKRQNAA